MSAANTDLVRKSAPNFATTLSGAILNTDTSLTLSSATGLPTTTAITLVIDATDPTSGASTPALKEVVTGTLSGTTVSNLLRGQDGTSAIGHASGANVVMWITANLWNDFQTAFLQDHKQLGYHGSLTDANGNSWLAQTATASAVNQATLANAATGNPPVLSATGSDSNIGFHIAGKGTSSPHFFGYYDGWVNPNETWTYASGTGTNQATFTIAGVDVTGKYNVGDRVKFTQTTVKYGIIVATAFSTNTTISIYMGTDYTMANAAITSNFFSHESSPVGFPMDPAKWTITSTSTSNRTTTSATFATLTDNIVVAIGAWRLYFKAAVDIAPGASNVVQQMFATLSSDASTETNPNLTLQTVGGFNATGSAKEFASTQSADDYINVAAVTTYLMMGKTTSGTTGTVVGSQVKTIMRAVCAYL